MDTDTIDRLGQAMRTIADATPAESAQERRALVQMLAVAMALDPSDEKARSLVREIPERDFEPKKSRSDAEKEFGRIWKAVEWLETADAGIDGQALAACLKDVMVIADSRNPRVDSLKSRGEQAAWNGWVPALAAYEEQKKPREDNRGDTDQGGDQNNGPGQQAEDSPRIRLAQATVPALFWKNVAKDWPPKWVLMQQTLNMKAAIRPREEWEIEQGIHRKTIAIGSYPGSDLLHSVESRIESILRKKIGSLPNDLVIEILHPELDQSIQSGRRNALSAVCGVVAYAALKGVEPSGLVIGGLEEDGRFMITTDFWGQLQPLLGMSGLRVIVPAESEPIMMSILAMEKPEFFFNNEVFLAKDLDEALMLAAKNPQAPLDGVVARFKEIQDKRGVQDIRTYTANIFIRQRLTAIQQEEPRHLSSKALVIQALGKRPTTVTRAVLASEATKALEPLAWVRTAESFEPRTNRPLSSSYDDCKGMIDKLARVAERADQELLEKVMEAASAARDIERASKGRGEYWEVENDIRAKKRTFDDEYDDVLERLNQSLMK